MDDLSRAIAFRHRLLGRICPDSERSRFGVAYLDPAFPLRHDSNLLVVDRPIPGVGAEDLHRELNAILGSRGLAHRKIAFDHQDDALRVAMGLAELGYQGSAAEVMVLDRDRLRSGLGSVVAKEVGFREVRPLILESNSREPFADSHDVIAQLTDIGGVLEQRAGCRFFVAREPGGLMASSCELYVDADEAQIEDVRTLEEYRGAGLAGACVAAAIHAAREAGAAWIHLFADQKDWPKEWYARLGFEPAGSLREFTMWNANA